MTICNRNTSKIFNIYITKGYQTFTVSQALKEKCAHMNKKSSNHDSLHADVKINICTQFTTHNNLTDLNMYKY